MNLIEVTDFDHRGLKGKKVSGAIEAWHINIGKKHIILNPMHWGKLTSNWWNPIK